MCYNFLPFSQLPLPFTQTHTPEKHKGVQGFCLSTWDDNMMFNKTELKMLHVLFIGAYLQPKGKNSWSCINAAVTHIPVQYQYIKLKQIH